jgi:uncharacterized protein (TIGR03382 family)
VLATGFGPAALVTGSIATGPGSNFPAVGDVLVLLRLTYGALVSTDQKLISLAARQVSEPGMMSLAGLGLAAALWRRRRRPD